MIEGKKLTIEMHKMLKGIGYAYFLIKSVNIDSETGKLISLGLSPIRHIPSTNLNGCMGIDDGMIINILHGHHDIEITLTTHKESL